MCLTRNLSVRHEVLSCGGGAQVKLRAELGMKWHFDLSAVLVGGLYNVGAGLDVYAEVGIRDGSTFRKTEVTPIDKGPTFVVERAWLDAKLSFPIGVWIEFTENFRFIASVAP